MVEFCSMPTGPGTPTSRRHPVTGNNMEPDEDPTSDYAKRVAWNQAVHQAITDCPGCFSFIDDHPYFCDGYRSNSPVTSVNFRGRAAYLSYEDFHGIVDRQGRKIQNNFIDVLKEDFPGMAMAATEWGLINWVPYYNLPLDTAEHALFVAEGLLAMATQGVRFATLWDCWYGDTLDPPCRAFGLTSVAAGGVTLPVRIDFATQPPGPQIGYVPEYDNMFKALEGGYEGIVVNAYAVHAVDGRVHAFVFNKDVRPEQTTPMVIDFDPGIGNLSDCFGYRAVLLTTPQRDFGADVVEEHFMGCIQRTGSASRLTITLPAATLARVTPIRYAPWMPVLF